MNLVKIKNNDVFTDSLVIAEETGFQHHTITRKIRDNINDLSDFGRLDVTSKLLPSGQRQTIYNLNEMQATYLITLLENNDRVREFKKLLVKEFYRMRKFILERQTADWKQVRTEGKKVRKDETDVIMDKLIPLAESQGSKNADKLYMTYSKLVNRILGIEAGQRDGLPYKYLATIRFLENAIENIISIEVEKGTHYKEIYQICKVKCQFIKELSFLPSLPKTKSNKTKKIV